jgi:hypothetical protein
MLKTLTGFLNSWTSDWIGKMSGGASIILAFLAAYGPQTTGYLKLILWVASLLCFVAGSYHVWKKEHLQKEAQSKQIDLLHSKRPVFRVKSTSTENRAERKIHILEIENVGDDAAEDVLISIIIYHCPCCGSITKRDTSIAARVFQGDSFSIEEEHSEYWLLPESQESFYVVLINCVAEHTKESISDMIFLKWKAEKDGNLYAKNEKFLHASLDERKMLMQQIGAGIEASKVKPEIRPRRADVFTRD